MAKRTVKHTLLDNASMDTTVVSYPFNVENFDNVSLQASYTGSPNGTFTVEASLDVGANPTGAPETVSGLSHWTQLTSYTQSITDAGSVLWSIEDLNVVWIRVKFTRTSGSGNLTVKACAFGKYLTD